MEGKLLLTQVFSRSQRAQDLYPGQDRQVQKNPGLDLETHLLGKLTNRFLLLQHVSYTLVCIEGYDLSKKNPLDVNISILLYNQSCNILLKYIII